MLKFDRTIQKEFHLADGDVQDTIEIPFLVQNKYLNTRYGDWEVNDEYCDKIIGNFKAGIIGRDVLLDENHDGTNKGKLLEIVKRGKELFGKILMNDAGKAIIKNYKYSSPVLRDNYVDKLSGKEVGPVLKFISLTNDPFQPGLSPIFALDDEPRELVLYNENYDELKKSSKEGNNMEMTALEKKLSDDLGIAAATIEIKDDSIKSLTDELDAEKANTKKLTDELTGIKADIAEKEKKQAKAEFDKKLTDRKNKIEELVKTRRLDPADKEKRFGRSLKADEEGVKLLQDDEDFDGLYQSYHERKEGQNVALGSGNTDGVADDVKGSKRDPNVKKLMDEGMTQEQAVLKVYPTKESRMTRPSGK